MSLLKRSKKTFSILYDVSVDLNSDGTEVKLDFLTRRSKERTGVSLDKREIEDLITMLQFYQLEVDNRNTEKVG